ncbi:MAG: OmpA family protein [Saprospiraceae bacterium]
MRINVLLLLICCFSHNLFGQNKAATSISELRALLDKGKIFGDSTKTNYQPDSAYQYTLDAQSAFRKLRKGDQKKLEKEGITTGHFSQLKRQYTEQAFRLALQQGQSKALDDFLEKYPRITFSLAIQARQARNELFFSEQRDAGNYDVLLAFLEANRSSLQENSPELVPKLEEAVVLSFLKKYPDPPVQALFNLMNRYPRLTPFMDETLARVINKSPFTYQFEDQFRLTDNHLIPKAIQALYPFYACYGEATGFERFYNNFPEMIDSVNFREEYGLARKTPAFSEETDQPELLAYIKKAAPSYRAYQSVLLISKKMIDDQDWTALAETLQTFEEDFKQDTTRLSQLQEIISTTETPILSESFGDQVNTAYPEYSPVITADGQTLYFCRLMDEVENIYTSQKEGETWSKPVPIKRFHTFNNEAPLAVSADGSNLILFINGQVMISEKTAKGWSEPMPFFSTTTKSIWQGGTTVAADKKVVIFAARRPDRIGLSIEENIDLYISYKLPNDTWSAPQNLGTTLNTPWEERSPFLHPDMRTLYFSSNGHAGLGGLDVFKTTRVGDSWTEWTTPVNLGKTINTTANDWGYKVSTDGREAYFSKQIPEKGEDLFSLLLPDKARPQDVATLEGKLLGVDGQPLTFSIIVEDMETGETAGEINPDPISGHFFISLPLGKLYSYRVDQPGYYPISNNIDLRSQTDQLKQIDNIVVPNLTEIVENNIAIPLKNLFFETSKFDIKSTSFTELKRLAQLLLAQDLKVEISGHTDNVGSAEYNLTLSQNRAQATKDFLIQQGVSPNLISATGFGMDQPIASNEIEEGRAQNRRVEIRFKPIEK